MAESGGEFVLILPESDKETAARILRRVRFELDRAARIHFSDFNEFERL